MSKKIIVKPASATTPTSVVVEDTNIAEVLFAALSADLGDDIPAAETSLNAEENGFSPLVAPFGL